jgi:hypothetical protein
MANIHVVVSVRDEVRLDSLIPEEHFGGGYFVTNRIMGVPSFTVGARVTIGDAEIGEIVAISQAALDDRWQIHYTTLAEIAKPAEVEVVPAKKRVRKPRVAAPPAGAAQAEADAQLASAMLASIDGTGGDPGAGGHEEG